MTRQRAGKRFLPRKGVGDDGCGCGGVDDDNEDGDDDNSGVGGEDDGGGDGGGVCCAVHLKRLHQVTHIRSKVLDTGANALDLQSNAMVSMMLVMMASLIMKIDMRCERECRHLKDTNAHDECAAHQANTTDGHQGTLANDEKKTAK